MNVHIALWLAANSRTVSCPLAALDQLRLLGVSVPLVVCVYTGATGSTLLGSCVGAPEAQRLLVW